MQQKKCYYHPVHRKFTPVGVKLASGTPKIQPGRSEIVTWYHENGTRHPVTLKRMGGCSAMELIKTRSILST
ncbi:MAG: hypothetical protein JW915_12165 [Chitinispirillaceae bacterium]|nr:hypothetical protein [Chitinispirillaceae bacterium]